MKDIAKNQMGKSKKVWKTLHTFKTNTKDMKIIDPIAIGMWDLLPLKKDRPNNTL